MIIHLADNTIIKLQIPPLNKHTCKYEVPLKTNGFKILEIDPVRIVINKKSGQSRILSDKLCLDRNNNIIEIKST